MSAMIRRFGLVSIVMAAAIGCSSSTPKESTRCEGVVCSASDQCHEAGTCDPETGACSSPNAPDDTGCSDGNACTQTDTCQAGVCVGSNPVVCTATDQCHEAGACDPGTGTCSNPSAADDTACVDGNACTQTDTCQAGVCVGSNPVVCTATDQCHEAGACDPGTGACSNPNAPDDTRCSDGDVCTLDACAEGVCVGTPMTCGAGTTCSPSTGECEGGVPTVVASYPSDGTTGVGVTTAVRVTFSTPMDPATLTAQDMAGACTGSLQVSQDDFASCIGLGAPAITGGDTAATIVPAGGLSFGSTYKVRITTAVRSAGGGALAAEVVQPNGFTTRTDACGTALVISQVYGGGGNAGGQYRNDFVELRNAGTAPVDTSGMFLQLQSASGTSAWTVQVLPAAVIPPGGYFLVQESAGADSGQPALPSPDFVPPTAFTIGATSGKVAITSSSTPLLGPAMTAAVVDVVGFGVNVNAFETAAAPAPSNSTAVVRLNGGCADANDNSLDFVAGPPTPRNSQTSALPCACTANETGSALEMDFCNIQFPSSTATAVDVATESVYARVFEDGFTQAGGAHAAIACQIGYGAQSVNPSTHPGDYVWTDAFFNVQVGNDDEYKATLTVPAAGDYGYSARFSRDRRNWTYCDLNGAGSNGGQTFEPLRLGALTVTPASDTRAPVITISAPPAQFDVTSDATASFTLSTDEPATICWNLDGGASTCSAPMATSFPASLLGLPAGSHTLAVTAWDAAANLASASRSWTVAF